MAERAVAPSQRVLVPSGQSYRRLLKSTPVLFGSVGSLVVVRNSMVSILAASVVALTLAGVAQFLHRERVVVTPTHIRSVRPVGLSRKRARDDIATVVSVRVTATPTAEPHRNLLVLDRRERPIVRLKSPHWTPEDMRQLVRWLGVVPEELDKSVTARRLGRRFPHVVSLSERYPFVANALVGVFMAAAIVVASLLLG